MWDVPRVVQKRRTMTDCAGSLNGVNFAISEKALASGAGAISTSLGGSVIKNVAVLVCPSVRVTRDSSFVVQVGQRSPLGRAGANHKLEGTITQNEDLFSGGRENVCLLYDLGSHWSFRGG